MRKKIKIVVTHFGCDVYRYIGYSEGLPLFQNTFEGTTEGITELIGAIHGLMWLKKNNQLGDVFVKNTYIKECIDKKEYNHKPKGEKANTLLRRSFIWLLEQKSGVNIELTPEIEQIKDSQQIKGVTDVTEEFKERKTWFNRD